MIDARQIQLVASDLDGTLLGADSWISERNIDAVRRLDSQGVEFVAATGRSHPSALPRIRPLGVVRWLIASNGATLYDLERDEVAERRLIRASDVGDIVHSIENELGESGFAWETVDGLAWDQAYIDGRKRMENPKNVDPGTVAGPMKPGHYDVAKIMVVNDGVQGRELAEQIRPLIGAEFNVVSSGKSFMEITAPGADKAHMLASLCDRLDVGQASTMAFGDQANDAKMLAWVAYPFAMENGDPIVRASIPNIAPHHELDGVAQVLERYWPPCVEGS